MIIKPPSALHILQRTEVCAQCTFATTPNESLNRNLRRPQSLSLSISFPVSKEQCVIARYDVGGVYVRHAIPRPPDNCCKTTAPSSRACSRSRKQVYCPSWSPINWPLFLPQNKQLLLVANIRDRENGGRTDGLTNCGRGRNVYEYTEDMFRFVCGGTTTRDRNPKRGPADLQAIARGISGRQVPPQSGKERGREGLI